MLTATLTKIASTLVAMAVALTARTDSIIHYEPSVETAVANFWTALSYTDLLVDIDNENYDYHQAEKILHIILLRDDAKDNALLTRMVWERIGIISMLREDYAGAQAAFEKSLQFIERPQLPEDVKEVALVRDLVDALKRRSTSHADSKEDLFRALDVLMAQTGRTLTLRLLGQE